MKAAVITQMDALKKDHETRKVGVVAFDHIVDVIGDANEKTVQLDSNMCMDYDWLM